MSARDKQKWSGLEKKPRVEARKNRLKMLKRKKIGGSWYPREAW